MKKLRFLLAAFVMFLPSAVQAAQTAQARLYCVSLRFLPSTDQNDFYSLKLSSTTSEDNGELGPYFYFFDPTTTHSAYLDMVDLLFDDQYPGGMDLHVPTGGDANNNGWPDFFESAQAVSASSTGTYSLTGFGSGQVSATWSRSAGSTMGTCTLTLKNASFGNLVFYATFELMEYAGPLTYTPGSNTVSGSVALAQPGDLAPTLQGPVTFLKSAVNRFNSLSLQTATWTNAAQQTLLLHTNVFQRDLIHLTNYAGYVVFNDGDPNTVESDYYVWRLSINDTNDLDHDGIPDFSDDALSAPRRPTLDLARSSTNLVLTIHGDINRLHQVQELDSLLATNWQPTVSVTLTNDPQAVPLTTPAGTTKFWRVLAQ